MNTTQGKFFPKTLIEAVRYFSDLNVARTFFESMRWPSGVVCPQCGSDECRYLPKYRRWQCNHSHARRQFTVKTGTIMEDSPLGLDKWAVAFWLEVNAKNSISSYEIHRAIGVTQKSAWFMLHRIRHAIHTGTFEKLGGEGTIVEADETFVGGLGKNMHRERRERAFHGRGTGTKTAVMGLLARHDGKRHSTVRGMVVPNLRSETLRPIIHANVEAGSHVYTDAFSAYRSLGPAYFHDFVDHAETYAKGAVHTNGLENFWSLFKRCIKGTHVCVEPFHLGAYVDSEAFRFNNREYTDGQRFVLAVREFHGKRLTYKALTGALEASPGSDRGAENGSLPN
jgi:transposase-like protein